MNHAAMIPRDIRDLMPGERVLWQGPAQLARPGA